jgi:putative ABC transport system substrate-binding protein
MNRRNFIAGLGSAAAWPMAARAQQSTPPVIGLLSNGREQIGPVALLRQALHEQVFVEGGNLAIESRFADGRMDRLRSFASDLVSRRVAVIVAPGGAPAVAAKAATETVPIVFSTATDPVALGLAASLNRPGGNATGVSAISEASILKGIEFMRELVPGANSIAVLGNPVNPITPVKNRDAENAARTLGLRLVTLNASNPEEIESAFGVFAQQERPGGLVVFNDAMLADHHDQLVSLATRYRVPTVYGTTQAVLAGGLMSYGRGRRVLADEWRVIGNYVVRILRGEKPADLPVQLVTRIELAINLKTAKALGLTIPETLLATADEVIQ